MKVDLLPNISHLDIKEFDNMLRWLTRNIGPVSNAGGSAIQGEGWYLYRIDPRGSVHPRSPFWRVEFNQHVAGEDISWFTLRYGA